MQSHVVHEQLRELQRTASRIPEYAPKVSDKFVSDLTAIEKDLWRDTPKRSRCVTQVSDILRASFEVSGIDACVASTHLLLRRSNDGRRYDFNVCYQCKSSGKFEWVSQCEAPQDALERLVTDCANPSINVAVLNIIVIYNLSEDREACPEEYRTDFALHANMLVVDKARREAYVSDSNGMPDAEAKFYAENFQRMALRKLKEHWGITDLRIVSDAKCLYIHGGLCRYATVLTYSVPEARGSARVFAQRVVDVVRRMYIHKHFPLPTLSESSASWTAGKLSFYEDGTHVRTEYAAAHPQHGEIDLIEDGKHVRTEYAAAHPQHGEIRFFADGKPVRTEYTAAARRYKAWRRVSRCLRAVGRFSLCLRKAYEKVHRVHGPRLCSKCWLTHDKTQFTASQWAKSEKKRTCKECRPAPTTPVPVEEKRDDECCVCLDDNVHEKTRVYFLCQHWVCRGCARSMFATNKATNKPVPCPLCRNSVTLPVMARLIGSYVGVRG